MNYDYEIKTTQNLKTSEKDDFSKTNYELTENGICPKFCMQCNELKKCVKFREEPKSNDEEEKETQKKEDNKLYIIIGIIGFLLIIIIIIIAIRVYKKNKILKDDVNQISFKLDIDNHKEALLH